MAWLHFVTWSGPSLQLMHTIAKYSYIYSYHSSRSLPPHYMHTRIHVDVAMLNPLINVCMGESP